MYKDSPWRGCEISSCSLDKSTIIFEKVNYQLYQQLYKDLLVKTTGEKISKLRYMHNLERKELAQLISCNLDTIKKWEHNNVMPKPENIDKLCSLFDVNPEFFHEYYKVLKSNYPSKIQAFKKKKQLTYSQLSKLLNTSDSSLKRIVAQKLILSFNMYELMKDLNIL